MTNSRNTFFTIHRFMTAALGLSGNALLVYAAIYSFGAKRTEFYASVGYLAEITGSSASSVKNALRKLCERNLIAKHSASEYQTNAYAINMKIADKALATTEQAIQCDERLQEIADGTISEDKNNLSPGQKLAEGESKSGYNNKEII